MPTLPSRPPKSVTIGTGPDSIVMHISQTWYLADAQYNVFLDGVQVGANQTVSSIFSTGNYDTVTVKCGLAIGNHIVAINFLNDDWDGTPVPPYDFHDRNIYVKATTYDGVAIANSDLLIGNSESPNTITFDPKNLPPQNTPKSVTLGTGADSLIIHIAQTWYLANASYSISVDGVQIGANQTVSSIRNQGVTDTVTVHGDFASGDHTVSVNFLNDANDGVAYVAPNFHDRNIYTSNVTFNGTAVPNSTLNILTPSSPHTFVFNKAASNIPNNPPTSTTVGTGVNTIVMHISQDWYLANAQYSIAVDGVQIGGTLTASAIKAQGVYDTVTVKGAFPSGSHTLTLSLLNDASDGTWGPDGNTPNGHDRNVYVRNVTFNGTAVASSDLDLLNYPVSFTFQGAGSSGGGGTPNYPAVLTAAGITDARLTFSDEFSTLNISNDGTKKWRSDGDGSAWSVSNGILTLAIGGNLRSEGGYPSGFIQRYGYFEARMQLSSGTGVWPGIYLSGKEGSDYELEIDQVENFGNPHQYEASFNVWKAPDYGNVPWDQAPWVVDPQGTTWDTQDVIASADLTQGFHTYGVLWQPGASGGHVITFYLDDQVVARDTVAASLGDSGPGDELVIQNFLQGNGGSADTPLLVDWVRVWQLAGH